MKIDFDAIAEGYQTELSKTADAATDALRSVPGVGGHVPNSVLGGGISDSAIGWARDLYDHPSKIDVDKMPFWEYINQGMYDNYNRKTLLGHLWAPVRHGLGMVANTGRYVGNALVNQTPLKGINDAVKGVSKVTDIVGGAATAAGNAMFPQGANDGQPGLLDRLRRIVDDAQKNPEELKKLLPEIGGTILDKGKDYLSGNASPGAYILPALAAGGTAAAIYRNRKNTEEKRKALEAKTQAAAAKAQQPGAQQHGPTHIHIHNSPYGYQRPSLASMAPQDDQSNEKYSSLKSADMVDALASSVGRRMADKVLNHTAGQPQHHEEAKEKQVEITTKYPEMEKMLKKKKNKEYLEKLLKD